MQAQQLSCDSAPPASVSEKRPSLPLFVCREFAGLVCDSAIISAPLIAAPLGSVIVPISVAFDSVCAREVNAKEKNKAVKTATADSMPSFFPPLPLARELKVVPARRFARNLRASRPGSRAPSVSWLGGSIERRGLPIPLPARWLEPARGTVVRARQFPPYSRAAATAFHRLPVHGVSGELNTARESSKRLGNCYRNSSQQPSPYPRAAGTSVLSSKISNSPSRIGNLKSQFRVSRRERPSPPSRSSTRGRPLGLVSTSSGASNTGSRISRR